MHTQLGVSEYNCIYFPLFFFLFAASIPTTELLFWRVMSLLTHRLTVWLCLWYPEKECRTVAHPKSHRTQAPLALTSTLELLRSPWATGGLRASARKRGKVWFEGLMAVKLPKEDCVVCGCWSSELKWQILTYEPNQNSQITQYAHPDKIHTPTMSMEVRVKILKPLRQREA